MTQAQTDDLMVRLDAQHDELLQRIDELDRKIAATLAEKSVIAPMPKKINGGYQP